MTDLRQAAQQALEALEHCCFSDALVTDKDVAADAIYTLRTALAQQQAEPVAWMELLREARDNCKASIVEEGISASRKEYRIDLEARLTAAMNTTPPHRQWVGLTDEDFLEACQFAERGNYLLAFQRIQIKLKERNT